MTKGNTIKQTIKYSLLALVLLVALMYVPTVRLSLKETAGIVAVGVGSLVLMDHWCPSVRYCLRDMDACINDTDPESIPIN